MPPSTSEESSSPEEKGWAAYAKPLISESGKRTSFISKEVVSIIKFSFYLFCIYVKFQLDGKHNQK